MSTWAPAPPEPPAPAAAPASATSAGRRRLLVRAGALALLLGTFGWAFHDVHPAAVWAVISAADPVWVGGAAGLYLLVVLFQSARWLALVKPMAPSARLTHAYKSSLVGFAVSSVLPARAGELVRIEWLGRFTGLSRLALAGSALLDQLVNAAALLAAVAVLPLFLNVPLWMRQGGWLATAVFSLGLALVVVLARRSPQAEPTPPAADTRPLPLRTMANMLARVRAGLAVCRDPRAISLSFVASLMAWGSEVGVTAMSMHSVGLHLPIGAAVLVLIAVNLALAVPGPPGNMGTLEMGATLALLEFKIAKEQALAFALTYHLLQVIPVGIIGFLLLSRGTMRQAAGREAA